MIKRSDGSKIYRYPYYFTTLTVNGVSILTYQPVEATVGRDGWGTVVMRINPETGEGKTYIDGQPRLFTLTGYVQIE